MPQHYTREDGPGFIGLAKKGRSLVAVFSRSCTCDVDMFILDHKQLTAKLNQMRKSGQESQMFENALRAIEDLKI